MISFLRSDIFPSPIKKFGVGGKSKFDLISLAVALIAFVLLFIVEGVLIGLLLALIVDGIGAMLTIRKLLIDPSSESKWFWGIGDDGLPLANQDKAGFWKCPYHNTRMCLELINRLKSKEITI